MPDVKGNLPKLLEAPDYLQAFDRPRVCKRCALGHCLEDDDGNSTACLMGDSPLAEGVELSDVKLMIVGDFPSKHDVEVGFPYIGEQGILLDTFLETAGIDRYELYITYALKCVPLNKDKIDHISLLLCRKYLEEEIKRVQPDVILSVGIAATHSLIDWSPDYKILQEFDDISEAVERIKNKKTINGDAKLIDTFTRGKTFKDNFLNITERRGSVYDSPEFGCYIVPTFSLYSCIPKSKKRGSEESVDSISTCFLHDLKMTQDYEELKLKSSPAPIKFKVADSLDKVKKVAEYVKSLPNDTCIAFDTETGGLDFTKDDILCVSMSWSDCTGVVIPLKGQITPDMKEDYELAKKGLHVKCPDIWNPYEYKEVVKYLNEILQSDNPKILQNGKFDVKFFWKLGIKVNNYIFDTMLAHFLLDENLPHDLEFLSNWYTDMGRYDFELQHIKPNSRCNYSIIPTDILYEYASKDVMATLRVYRELKDELHKHPDLEKLFYTHYMPFQEVMTEIEYRGIKVDLDVAHDLEEKMGKQIEDIEKSIVEKYNDMYHKVCPDSKEEFNVYSLKQLRSLMFDGLKLPILKTTKEGYPSLDKGVMQELSEHHELPQKIIELRELGKLKGTYVKGFKRGKPTGLIPLVDDKGFIHTSFLLHGARTGRISSRDPNLQNIPNDNDIRQMFVPREGYKFIEADYKAAEIRVLAYVSNDPKLIARCKPGVDIHSETAADLFDMPVSEILALKEAGDCPQRRISKNTLFGVIYGESAYSLAPKINVSVEEAQTFINKLFETYGKVYRFINKTHREAVKNNYVESVFGRRRRLPFYLYTKEDFYVKYRAMLRQSVNAPIQATASDLTAMALVRMHNRFKRDSIDARVVLTVHDSILVETLDTPTNLALTHKVIDEEMIFSFPKSDITFLIDKDEGYFWEKH